MRTVSDFIIERLVRWGVERVFGFPGDGINGIIGALRRAEDKLPIYPGAARGNGRVHGVRACQVHRRVGVCLATSGPGAIHLLNGLYDAQCSITSRWSRSWDSSARAALGGHYQQEVDLVSLFKDVAHEYVHMVTTPAQARHVVDQRNAHRRGPTHGRPA